MSPPQCTSSFADQLDAQNVHMSYIGLIYKAYALHVPSFQDKLAFLFWLLGVHDGEIVGLCSSSNGRACEHHVCCGMHVTAGTLLHLKIDLELEGGLPKASCCQGCPDPGRNQDMHHWISAKVHCCKTSSKGTQKGKGNQQQSM